MAKAKNRISLDVLQHIRAAYQLGFSSSDALGDYALYRELGIDPDDLDSDLELEEALFDRWFNEHFVVLDNDRARRIREKIQNNSRPKTARKVVRRNS